MPSPHPVNSPAAIAALVDSLRADPFYCAISDDCAGDEDGCRAILTRYFDYSLTEGERYGRTVVRERDAPGAAVWLLPCESGRWRAAKAQKRDFLAQALGARGCANYHRIVDFMAPRAAAMVEKNAWYLSIVGVAPSAQGLGIGAELLRPTLIEADTVRAVCYLETFSPRSTSFYRRLGFDTVGCYVEPTTGAECAVMVRPPGQPAAALSGT